MTIFQRRSGEFQGLSEQLQFGFTMDTLFFLISKMAWAVLSPINLILLLLIVGSWLWQNRYWQDWGKRIFFTGAILAFTIMAYPVGDFLIQPLEKRFPLQTEKTLPKEVDGIIILGGGEELGRSLSWKTPQVGLGGDRYIAAKYLSQRYPDVPVIFTGGSGDPFTQNSLGEGWVAKALFQQLGIEPNRWIIESKSRNTYENFKLVKPLLPKQNGTYLLVTSAYHMPRSVGIARKQGIQVIPYPTDFLSYDTAHRHFDLKTYDHLHSLQKSVREWIGLTVYYLTGKTSSWLPGQTSREVLIKTGKG